MTAEIHTCSYECERPGCIRAQRDELAARLTAAMSQPAEAQAQGGGEVVAWAVVGNKSGEILNVFHGTREKWLADTKYWPEHGFRTRPLVYGDTAPPSAPVGVEDVVMAARNAENAIRNCAAAGQIGEGYVQYADDLRDAVQRLAQQPAAVDGMAELVGLLDEVRSHFTRDDDLPDDLLPRIDAALAGKQGGDHA